MSFCCTDRRGGLRVWNWSHQGRVGKHVTAACGPASAFRLFCLRPGSVRPADPLGTAPSAGGSGDGSICCARRSPGRRATELRGPRHWPGGWWVPMCGSVFIKEPPCAHCAWRLVSTHSPRSQTLGPVIPQGALHSPWDVSLDMSVQQWIIPGFCYL